MKQRKPKFQVISFDIFRTLVDLDQRASCIYQKIMNKKGTKRAIRRFWMDTARYYRIELEKVLKSGQYVGFFPLFVEEMKYLSKQYNLPLRAEEYAHIILTEEKFSPLFSDALSTISMVQKSFDTCIVSDTDENMVQTILPQIPISTLFLSCDYKSYKEDPANVLFKAVVNHYKIDPSQILHIGDSYSDVLGAKRAGLKTCWINPYKPWLRWKYPDIKPDYSIRKLTDLLTLL